MACYYPLEGWRSKHPNDNGKYPVVFTKSEAALDQPLTVACGRCIGCRLDYSRNWSIRCVHETQMHDDNCFITLTYNDENLPHAASLKHEDFQNFMKRLRKKLQPHKIRFYMCGEYGENGDLTTTSSLGRPHYHAIIFNYDFPDKKLLSTNNGNPLYTSNILSNCWGHGHSSVGAATLDSAAYVARYLLKKIGGDQADDHYTRVDPVTGEISFIHREYASCSTKPGIGYEWFKKYKTDLHKDYITVNGAKLRPPKYYDNLLEKYDEDRMISIKQNRSNQIDSLDPELALDRLRVKEQIKLLKLTQLPRDQL